MWIYVPDGLTICSSAPNCIDSITVLVLPNRRTTQSLCRSSTSYLVLSITARQPRRSGLESSIWVPTRTPTNSGRSWNFRSGRPESTHSVMRDSARLLRTCDELVSSVDRHLLFDHRR